jgi:general secretion pathway protein G
LIELLIAITVLAALIAIALPQFTSYKEQARVAQAIADIRNIDISIQVYKRQNNALPTKLSEAFSASTLDPWKNAYVYLKIEGEDPSKIKGMIRKDQKLVPINSDFDLYSIGVDGNSFPPLDTKESLDDIVRANDGRFVGRASDF